MEDPVWVERRLRSRHVLPAQWRDRTDDTTYLDDNLEVRGNVTAAGVLLGAGGGEHPNLGTHDALGLATDAELTAHATTGDPHTVYATNAELDLHTSDEVDVHDASAISILDTAGTFTAGEVEGALAELTADDAAHAALPNGHHQEFTNAQHDGLPNPHHSNANDHPQSHGHASHTGIGASDHHTAFVQADHDALPNPHHSSANDHANTLDHARGHNPTAAADHPVSGLTPGDVLTALTASSIGWQTPGAGSHPDLATHDALGLATQAELDAHLTDATDAHDASAISILDTAADFTATDVEGALAELQADNETFHHSNANDHANTLDHARQHSITAAADHTFPGGTTDFLRADGAFAAPPGGGGGVTKISGNSGAFVADTTWETLTADSSGITSTTQTTVMTLTGLAAGTYRVKGTLIWKTAATGTGIGITLNHTGTLSQFVSTWWTTTTGGTAATGIADQVTTTAGGQMLEGKSERVKDTRSSFNVGTDTANGTQLSIIEAILIVTASGSLELKIATEVAGSAATLLAGSTLEVNKIV